MCYLYTENKVTGQLRDYRTAPLFWYIMQNAGFLMTGPKKQTATIGYHVQFCQIDFPRVKFHHIMFQKNTQVIMSMIVMFACRRLFCLKQIITHYVIWYMLFCIWEVTYTILTCPFKVDPLTPHFYMIVKLGFTRVYVTFLF